MVNLGAMRQRHCGAFVSIFDAEASKWEHLVILDKGFLQPGPCSTHRRLATLARATISFVIDLF